MNDEFHPSTNHHHHHRYDVIQPQGIECDGVMGVEHIFVIKRGSVIFFRNLEPIIECLQGKYGISFLF